jgi:cytidylate kinase
MNTPAGLEHCLSFINCHLQPPEGSALNREKASGKSAITISRQSGCGAHVVAEKLARYLQTRALPDSPPWTVFDRNLMETVLHDHQIPERLARFMPEDRVLQIDDVMNELFGLRPPSWTLVQQASETILRLTALGHVIILGRGANVVTARLPHVLHVRLVASLERRIEHMQHFEELGRKEAADRIQREDLGRQRYLKQHFGKDVDDPLLYHLVINTDLVSFDDAVQLVGNLMSERKVA